MSCLLSLISAKQRYALQRCYSSLNVPTTGVYSLKLAASIVYCTIVPGGKPAQKKTAILFQLSISQRHVSLRESSGDGEPGEPLALDLVTLEVKSPCKKGQKLKETVEKRCRKTVEKTPEKWKNSGFFFRNSTAPLLRVSLVASLF